MRLIGRIIGRVIFAIALVGSVPAFAQAPNMPGITMVPNAISGSSGVTSFNSRTGAVSLLNADVLTALAFTPLNPANNLSDINSAATSRTNIGLGAGNSPSFTGLTVSGISGSTQCLQVNTSGVLAGSGAACGGGTPGGSNTQVQYNNSGAFGGITGATTNGTALTLVAPILGAATGTSLAIGGATIGSNALAVTGLVNFASAGTAAAPTLSVGNSTTGLYSVSTTGLGIAVNGVVKLDYGITTSGGWTFVGNLYVPATIQTTSTTTLSITTQTRGGINLGIADGSHQFVNNAAAGFFLTAISSGVAQHGAVASAAAAVAQTIRAGGSSGNSAAAALFTIAGSDQTGTTTTGGGVQIRGGNGTSVGGTVEIWTSATTTPAVAATFAANKNATLAGQLIITNIGSDAALTDTTVCQDTTNHQFYSGSGTLGICLGTSGRQFKQDFAPMTAGLAEITKLDLQRFRYRKGFGDNGARLQYGLMAQDVEKILPDLAGHDANGNTINYDAGALLFISIRAIQELNDRVSNLEKGTR